MVWFDPDGADPYRAPPMFRPPMAMRPGAVALAMALLFAAPALLFASPAAAHDRVAFLPERQGRAAQCTGHQSQYLPPESIRVYRTRGPAEGTVQIVPFRDYVGVVFSTEWPSFYPLETLRAGAVAVKQFAWYYTMNWRGERDDAGNCYDVVDTTRDQLYRPETNSPSTKHLRAIATTWTISVRKWSRETGTSRFFLTGYRAGANGPCGSDADGFRIYQHTAYQCGVDGLSWEQILRTYQEPRLEIVDPGHHDIIGDGRGDASVLLPGASAETAVARLYQTAGGVFLPAVSTPLDMQRVLPSALRSADLSGDGFDELVALATTEATGEVRVVVARATGSGYGAAAAWWQGDVGAGAGAIRLLTGDFDADRRQDVGLIVPTANPGEASVLFLRSLGSTLEAPRTWWTGPLDLASGAGWAGDATGDGRADLIVREDLGAAGLRYLVAPSLPTGGGLSTIGVWLDAPDLIATETRHVVADYNRDGRDELLVVARAASGMTVIGLRSSGSAFSRSIRYTTPSSDPLPFARLRVATGDLNADGRSDLSLFEKLEDGSTRLHRVLGTETAMIRVTPTTDSTLPWDELRQY